MTRCRSRGPRNPRTPRQNPIPPPRADLKWSDPAYAGEVEVARRFQLPYRARLATFASVGGRRSGDVTYRLDVFIPPERERDIRGIELHHRSYAGHYAVIHLATKPGQKKWQISRFDPEGAVGDTSRGTLQEALEIARGDGYRLYDIVLAGRPVSKSNPDDIIDIEDANGPEEIQAALHDADAEHVKLPWDLGQVFVLVDGRVVEWDGEERFCTVWRSAQDYVNDLDVDLAAGALQDQENEDFWSSPSPLYHATPGENVEDVLRDGLEARAQSRGLLNKGVGAAVFTTFDLDEAQSGTYGDAVFEIDTRKMLSDGYTPYTVREPDHLEYDVRSAVAHALRDDEYLFDLDSSTSPYTIIVHGSISPRYLRRVQ